jgi:hypothetical protein
LLFSFQDTTIFLPSRDEWPGSYFEKYLFIILLLGVNVLPRTLFSCHFSVHGKCSLWAHVVDVESGDSVAERESWFHTVYKTKELD